MTRVAVLGLGRMGAAMAAALAEAGHEVSAWNRSESGRARLAEELRLLDPPAASERAEVTYAAGAAEAVAGAQVVVAMLADGPAVEDVLFGGPAVADALVPGAVFCDMGTSGVDTALRCADRLATTGHAYLDAPVSGSVATVRAHRLLVMAGGPPDVVDAVDPVFGAFAGRVLRVGDAGSGQAMKLSVNAIVHILDGALSEALVLAERGGVDRDTALEVIASSVVAAPFVQYKRAAFADPRAQPVAFTIDLMRKDLALVRRFAGQRGAAVPLAEAVAHVADLASAAGLGGRDMAELAVYHRADV
ncbi:MAG: NAD(P)-dependent oxidoreductase [Actinocrinis sp.]